MEETRQIPPLRMLLMASILSLLASCSGGFGGGRLPGVVYSTLPELVDPNERYVFYIHGKIIEDQGRGAVSEDFGPYEVDPILQYLAEAGFAVIGEFRTGPTDVDAYSDRVLMQIHTLLDAGVAPEKLTIIGFSKGGYITLLSSSKLADARLNYVAIGICVDEINNDPRLRPEGRILSIYEESDEFGSSCQRLIERSPGVKDFTEIVLKTGKRHGAFYRADPTWLDPVVSWIYEAGD